MSSINILNRCTASHQGGGLPFYDNNTYIFSFNNEGFNSPSGLWTVPPRKIPTFQLFVPALYDTVNSFDYIRTQGNNVFTATIIQSISIPQSTAVTFNGVAQIVWQADDTNLLALAVPDGRYIIHMILTDSATGTQFLELWSEEFLAKDCC